MTENRRRRQRALMATALCAQGVPHLLAGDELGRTQEGRANGYTLEPIEWGVAWSDADWDLMSWVSAAIELRHEEPVLRRPGWVAAEEPALVWRSEAGRELTDADWSDAGPLQVLLDGTDLGGRRVLLLLVPGNQPATFGLPDGRWEVRLDAAWTRPPRTGQRPLASGSLEVGAPGFVALVASVP